MNEKPALHSFTLAHLGGLCLLLMLIGWIASDADSDSSVTQDAAQQQILKDMGPDNPMARRINSLNQNNAYGAGVVDGSRDALNMSVKMNWQPYDYQEKLTELRSLKSDAFDILASQNKFDSAVFEKYKSGWDRGASSLSVNVN